MTKILSLSFALQGASFSSRSTRMPHEDSRPYFNTDVDYNYEESEKLITNKDDWSKVKDIFKLWDRFLIIFYQKICIFR